MILAHPRDRRTIVDVAVLAAGTIVLRVPAFLSDKHLTFDDGVYGASAVAMRAGGKPFAEVFSSQGPLFLPLVWAADVIGLRTANAPRVLALASGCILVLAVHATARALTDRAGALLAAGFVTTSIGLLGVTGPLAADGPALAAAAVAVLLAVRWRDAPTAGHALGLGLAAGVALSIKSLVLPAVVPSALVLLAWRRPRWVALAAGTALALHVVIALPWGLADVWDQSYAYHLEVVSDRTPVENVGKVAATLFDRELPLVVAAALAAAAFAFSRRRVAESAPSASRMTSPVTLVVAWLVATLAVLVLEHPLWRPHIAHLVAPGAMLVARYRPSWKVLVPAAVLVAPYHVAHAWSLLQPPPYRSQTAAVVATIRDLPEGALAISDDPGVVWRAGRRTPDHLVDGSILRIEVGDITSATVAADAAHPDVCAVAVRSRARWGSFEDLPERLAGAGYEVALRDDDGRVLYVKPRCEPR